VLRFRRLKVSTEHNAQAERLARALLPPATLRPAFRNRRGQEPSRRTGRSPPGASVRTRWLGSPAALAVLGLAPGMDVIEDHLVRALQGRHAVTREHMRPTERVMTPDLDFVLTVPELAAEVWRRSGPEQRAKIEQALLSSAERAIVHMFVGRRLSTDRSDNRVNPVTAVGVAAVAAVHAVPRPANGQPEPSVELVVRGMVLGVQRSDGKFVAGTRLINRSKGRRHEAELLFQRSLTDDLPWLMRYSGRQAAAAVLALERSSAPLNAHREAADAARSSRRIGVPRYDPLDQWREWVGDRRAERIGARADALRDRLEPLGEADLLTRRRALQAAFAPPDRAAARRALSLERDVTTLEETAAEARRDVARLEQEAAVRKGRRRSGLLKAAAVIHDRIAAEDSVREQLLQSDGRLPASELLDAWMERHVEQAAELVAVDRHLSARLHRRIANDADRAVLDPPDYVRMVIGAAPEPSAPEHDQWVTLASALVHDEHAAASCAAGYEPPPRDPREQRSLDERIQSLRARGLEPADAGKAIEPVSAGAELDL
jgi:hypothetical protein